MNHVEFIGTLEKVPQYSTTNQGVDVCTLELTVIDSEDRTSQPIIKAFGYLAVCANRLAKGAKIHVEAKYTDVIRTNKSGGEYRLSCFVAKRIFLLTMKGRTEVMENICHEQITISAYVNA